MSIKERIVASVDASRPGVAAFGLAFACAALLAGGSLGLLR